MHIHPLLLYLSLPPSSHAHAMHLLHPHKPQLTTSDMTRCDGEVIGISSTEGKPFIGEIAKHFKSPLVG